VVAAFGALTMPEIGKIWQNFRQTFTGNANSNIFLLKGENHKKRAKPKIRQKKPKTGFPISSIFVIILV
jgi:hypothetical protein